MYNKNEKKNKCTGWAENHQTILAVVNWDWRVYTTPGTNINSLFIN